jgi:hypothetical protein
MALMAQTPQDQGWRALAAQASKEMDEEKLLRSVDQLCNAFDERYKQPQSEHDQNRCARKSAS